MTYQEAIAFLKKAELLGSVPGLDTIRALLRRMGNPERDLPVIHVAGTNGKGSVVAYLCSILTAQGYRVGRFTSPDLVSFTERININGGNIPEIAVARLMESIAAHAKEMELAGEGFPTVFEISTAMAFQYFKERCCNLVVLEVGLGGRLDATNEVQNPLVSVITSIGMDHMELLGDTLAKIAWEKAGIIKEGCSVVTAPQPPEALRVIEQVCREKHAELFPVRKELLQPLSWDSNGQNFNYGRFQDLHISMLGEHQMVNAALAINAVQIMGSRVPIRLKAIQKGLSDTNWPGRLEVLSRDPLALVDGAHNPQGVTSLVQGLSRHFPGRKFRFVVGVLTDKNYQDMFDQVFHLAQSFVTVTPGSSRALPAPELAKFLRRRCSCPVEAAESVPQALSSALPRPGSGEALCAFGSLYYVGEVRQWFARQTDKGDRENA